MANVIAVIKPTRKESCPNCGTTGFIKMKCRRCGKMYCGNCKPFNGNHPCDEGASAGSPNSAGSRNSASRGGGGVAVGVGAASVGAGVGSVLKGAGSVLGGFGSYMNDGLKQAQGMRAEEEAEYQKASEFIQKIPTHRFSDDPAEIVEEIYKIASMVKQFTPYRLRYTSKSNNLRRVYESAAPKMKQGIEKLESLAERARKAD